MKIFLGYGQGDGCTTVQMNFTLLIWTLRNGYKDQVLAQWLQCGLGHSLPVLECLGSSPGSSASIQLHADVHPRRQEVREQVVGSLLPMWKTKIKSLPPSPALAVARIWGVKQKR